MEDHDQQHQLQQQHQYEAIVPDFGLAPTPSCYPSSIQPAEISYTTRNPNSASHHYDMLMMAHQHQNYQQQLLQENDHQLQIIPHHHHEMMMHNNNNNTGSSTSGGFAATENTSEANVCDGGAGGGGRWPRQETLTLLEIRSRLDHKFKEANQKGPLWDEISRIMSDEHGYLRSGKKCREKFENLYKYYKKTREGKAGRQDGKHYRFFRQLEALYGENKTSDTTPMLPLQEASHFSGPIYFDHLKNNTPSCSNPTNTLQLGSNTNNHQILDSLSLSCNSSEFNSSSSEDYSDLNGTREEKGIKKRRGRKNWRAKIKEFIDSQMRSVIEIQEVWLAKIMKTIEQTEQERVLREEEWRKKEEERMDRERKFWATERQWVEARDANLMEALRKFNRGDVLEAFNSHNVIMPSTDHHNDSTNNNNQWNESEIAKLVHVRAGMESKFEQVYGECNWGKEFVLWEEIATRMASLGSNKSSLMCKNKWESINSYLVPRNKSDFGYKKQKGGGNSRSSSGCYGTSDNNQVEGIPLFGCSGFDEQIHRQNSMSSSNLNTTNNINNNVVQQQDQSFFRFLMVDHEGGSGNQQLWGNNNNL
ncbi:unnamed protein product [Rhodiola kirilowii]